MDLTDRQRKFTFVGLVLALAGVGIYLTLPARGDGTEPVEQRPATSAPAVPVPPTTAPPGIESSVAPDDFDIYRLLPFSRRDFAGAADLAQRFTAAYGTYRYDEDPRTYVQRLRGMVTDQLRAEFERSSSAPGMLEERKAGQVVAESTASVDSIRDIEANSLIFLVTGRQQLTTAGVKTEESKRYAVTVSRDGGSWRIYAFEPAGQGQAGDTG
ncbi:hypothetical protein [Actinomadura alba]|uniref:Mce-associated membrane protein n=1 Tax=Actinomadura alba TaxID=406431 RepID=A0ABR7LQZ0_9ACTN|nr:hypothetical protein [Actinomadura alba]MBC6467088.1 hypothetical protein [Actinomadura alba]